MRPTGRLVDAATRRRRLDTRIVAGFGVGLGLGHMLVAPLAARLGGVLPPVARALAEVIVVAGLHAIPVGLVAGLAVRTIPALRRRILAGPLPMAGYAAAVAATAAPAFPLPVAVARLVLGHDAALWTPPRGWFASAVAAGLVGGLVTWWFLRRWLAEAARDAAPSPISSRAPRS